MTQPDRPSRARRRTILACVLLLCAALGCEGTRRSSAGKSRPRAFAEVEWRQRWQVGGSEGDTVVLMPSSLVTDDERVYVLESGLHRIVALRLADAGVAWRAGGQGSGPAEFRRPTAIALGARGEVLVLDQGNGRIAVLDEQGAVRRHVPLPDVGYPSGLCALDDGTYLLATLATEHPVVRVSAAGSVVDRYELPRPDLAGAGSLPLQGVFARDAAGQCVYALYMGRGFARFVGERFAGPYDYVEWFDVPGSRAEPDSGGRRESMAQGITAAQGVTADVGGIAVGFGGTTDDAGRLLDLYDAATGAYTGSLRAPHSFRRMTRSGNLYVFITRVDGFPAVTAQEARIKDVP